jgi:hypothetical protein
VLGDEDRNGVRPALGDASAHFVALVEAIEPRQFAGRGTAEWSMLELVAHTSRAFLATERVLATPLDDASPLLAGAAEYYRSVFATERVHEGILERSRVGALEIREDPAGEVRSYVDRVAPLVATTPLTTEVQHFAGRMAFGEYLRTRITELVLHTVDLQLALGQPPSVPERPARLVRDLMLELAAGADAVSVACALAGRRLPGGCDVLR